MTAMDLDASLSAYEKMLAGHVYRTGDPETAERVDAASALVGAYNATPAADMERRSAILREAFVAFGSAIVRSPVTWEFGHIAIGDGCFFNFDCLFLDSAMITVGSHVAVGPRVIFATATHPVHWHRRAAWGEDGAPLAQAMCQALPITVGDHVWIGAGATILPGVSIGARSTIGAGSVVNRSIPADVLAAGNPCRVIRTLEPDDLSSRMLP